MKATALPRRWPILFVSALSCVACSPFAGDGEAFTLYRNSALDEGMRVHVATFDAADGVKYNQTNCQIAADLFANQPGVVVRYWCEKGTYRE